ncbi:hypothetical protein [uncultured Leifsonia sp.]|uniref:hypothetical protein n=1 Tax=uncultured Leifsonia sp. TaxID=340359 RepID=UPI0028D21AEB|nr:hypothetical protein [uncultured Leifsonia sp.]
MAGERALSGSADTVRDVGVALSSRTVGADVYVHLTRAVVGLESGSGGAVCVDRLVTRIQASAAPVNAVQQADAAWGEALSKFGGQIEDLKRRARQAGTELAGVEEELAKAQARLDGFDGLDAQGEPYARRALVQAVAGVQERRAGVLRRLRALDEEREAADSAAAGAIASSRDRYLAARSALPEPPSVSTGVTVTVPGAGGSALSLAELKDPEKIRAVWDRLTAAQRQALITDFPLLIGNLEGIPLRDRNTANVITARQYRAEVESQILAFGLYRDTPGAGGFFDEKIAELRQEITSIDAILGDRNDRHPGISGFGEYVVYDEKGRRMVQKGTTLVAFNPLGDSMVTFQGMLDEETGDIPAWMTNVAISVPGTGSRLATLTDDLDRTKELFAGSGQSTGYFTWHGAPLPDAGGEHLLEAATRGFAEVAAPRLTVFANSLRLPQGTDLVVIAHSYGAAVLGGAERLGLRADRVVYVAPAGFGHTATGLEDFPNTKDKPHFAIQARNDFIGTTQGLSGFGLGHGTTDVLTAPGVTRLETGYLRDGDPGSGTIESTGWIDAHSAVFTRGSTAFKNIVGVVTGAPVSRYHPDSTWVDSYGNYIDAPGTGVKKPVERISPLDLSEVPE